LTAVQFHPEAETELLAAARYYEEQAQNLGLDFITAVEASCAQLVKFPEIGRAFGDRLRRFLVPHFPYAILYRKQGERLTVVAVANLHRRPGYWRSRE
jgi:toxin ParE1/3/4